jgi:hypothetical protein
VFGEFPVDELTPVRLEACQCAGLILAHQPAVTRDIARENGRQSTLDPFYSHAASLPEFTLRRYRWPINSDLPRRRLRESALRAI